MPLSLSPAQAFDWCRNAFLSGGPTNRGGSQVPLALRDLPGIQGKALARRDDLLQVVFTCRCRPRQDLDRLLGVPEEKPRGVVLSYRPTKVFQAIVEKALSLTAGHKGDEELQFLLSYMWNLCVIKLRKENPPTSFPRSFCDELNGIVLPGTASGKGSYLPLVLSADGDTGSLGRFRNTLSSNVSWRGVSGRNGENVFSLSFFRLPAKSLTWRP